jgi:prevent-host-death family protein
MIFQSRLIFGGEGKSVCCSPAHSSRSFWFDSHHGFGYGSALRSPVKLAAGKCGRSGGPSEGPRKALAADRRPDDIDQFCTVLYGSLETNMVNLILRKGAEEARNQLPDLLEAAEKGRSTIITRHGRPVAALVSIEAYGAAVRQQPLMPVAGSGRGLWGKNSTRTLRKLRDEWSR